MSLLCDDGDYFEMKGKVQSVLSVSVNAQCTERLQWYVRNNKITHCTLLWLDLKETEAGERRYEWMNKKNERTLHCSMHITNERDGKRNQVKAYCCIKSHVFVY